MTPDEWTDPRINDLAQKVDLMATAVTHVARHAVKIDKLEEDTREGRAALLAIAQKCEENTRRVEEKIDEKLGEQASNGWGPTQWAAVLSPTLAALIGAIALIVEGSPK